MVRGKRLQTIRRVGLAAGIYFSVTLTADAATIVYSNSGPYSGSVIEILGLGLDGVEYDVAFLYGSYNAVHIPESAFSNAADLMDAINFELNTPTVKAIARPVGTPADYRVATSLATAEVSYYTSAINILSGVWERQSAPPGPFTIDRGMETMWAVVSVSPAVVPIPGALPLLASGFGALGCIAWRRKRKLEKKAA